MKALSIRQPWAWLIIRPDLTDPAQRREAAEQGLIKNIENRNWHTAFRGRVYVHAGKGMTIDEYTGCKVFVRERFGDAIQLPKFEDLQRGGILGTVEIRHCTPVSESPWFEGEFGFVLKDAEPLLFRACKGALGFFEPVFGT